MLVLALLLDGAANDRQKWAFVASDNTSREAVHTPTSFRPFEQWYIHM